jgi:uncharacterized protein YbjT (DUF2867 family)
MRIAVAGGTGVVGRHVVEQAGREGHDVVVLSRGNGVDLVDGSGLDGMLDDVDTVVDVTSVATQSGRKSERFFGAVTRNLLAAEMVAGVGHHVVLSIVGVDRAPHGYYAGKVLQERVVEEGRVAWTIVRATQFHEFAGQVHDRMSLGPFVVVPRMRCQPVAAREVATRLVGLAVAGPSGRVADLGGPRQEELVDMVHAYAEAAHAPGRIVPIPAPGAVGKAARAGVLLPAPEADHGSQTYAEWLRATY